ASPGSWSACSFTRAATAEVYTLSLHDALPICIDRPPGPAMTNRRDQVVRAAHAEVVAGVAGDPARLRQPGIEEQLLAQFHLAFVDRKSTRLNSSHVKISYAVFCLKKKNQETT